MKLTKDFFTFDVARLQASYSHIVSALYEKLIKVLPLNTFQSEKQIFCHSSSVAMNMSDIIPLCSRMRHRLRNKIEMDREEYHEVEIDKWVLLRRNFKLF